MFSEILLIHLLGFRIAFRLERGGAEPMTRREWKRFGLVVHQRIVLSDCAVKGFNRAIVMVICAFDLAFQDRAKNPERIVRTVNTKGRFRRGSGRHDAIERRSSKILLTASQMAVALPEIPYASGNLVLVGACDKLLNLLKAPETHQGEHVVHVAVELRVGFAA